MEAIKTDMNTVFTSMTSWWGSAQSPDTKSDIHGKEDTQTAKENKEAPQKTDSAESSPSVQDPESKGSGEKGEKLQKEESGTEKTANNEALDLNIEEMSNKAMEAAKEWGCK